MSRRFFSIAVLPIVLLLTLFAGCGSMRSKSDLLDDTLLAYQRAVRWGKMQEAMSFLDPKALEENPVSKLTLQRFEQLQVIGYRVTGVPIADDKGFARQTVQIEFVNRHTQSPRTVIDQQVWQLEPETKKWQLTSGLPNLDQQEQ
jgi:hypothetical protein